MKIVYQNVIVIVYFAIYNYLCFAKDDSTVINVDAFFDEDEETRQLEIPIRAAIWMNKYKQMNEFNVDIHPIIGDDCLKCSKDFCAKIERNEAPPVAIFAGESSVMASPMMQAICTYLELPFIQVSWSQIKSFRGGETALNFHPSPDLLSVGLARILSSLDWNSFVILYETEEGLLRLQELLKHDRYRKDRVLDNVVVRQLTPKEDRKSLLKNIKDLRINQFVLDCATENIIEILQEAKEFKLMEFFHSYFITSLDADMLNFSALQTTANITTVKLINHENPDFNKILKEWERNEFRNGRRISLTPLKVDTQIFTKTALMHDAITALFEAVNKLHNEDFNQQNISCEGEDKFPHGRDIISTMKYNLEQKENALTGPIEFNENGERINFNLHIIDSFSGKIVGHWNAKDPTNVELYRSPDEEMQAYFDRVDKNIFLVSVRAEEPFVMLRKPKNEREVLLGNARFEGFSIDLMLEVGKKTNYTFEFELTEDGKYGEYVEELQTWDGLIGDILNYDVVFAVGDLTITPERKKVVDFSVPYLTLGIGLLMKDPASESKMFTFLNPLTPQVWFYTATLYLSLAIIIWLLARSCPSDWDNPHPCNFKPEELENMWSLKNCFWLCLGSIMNQGSDEYPKGIASRMSTAMWWFFSLIMTNSYIANLASFLTKEQQSEIKTIESLAKQNKIKYGMVHGGSTEEFFRTSNYSIYKRMYNNMLAAKPTVFEESNFDGIRRVQHTSNGRYAFLMESTQIEYAIETKCDLKEVGNYLQPRSYGIAMPLNSKHRKKINNAILELQADGFITTLKDKWWKTMRSEPSCPKKPKQGADLDLNELGGVFLVLGVGVGVAMIFGVLEFLWNVRKIAIEQHITAWKAFKMELMFALKFWITEKRVQPDIPSSPASAQGDDRRSIARSFLQGASSIFNLDVAGAIRSVSQQR